MRTRLADDQVWAILNAPGMSDAQLAFALGLKESTIHNRRWLLRRSPWICSVRYAPCCHCGEIATLRGQSMPHAYHAACRPIARQADPDRSLLLWLSCVRRIVHALSQHVCCPQWSLSSKATVFMVQRRVVVQRRRPPLTERRADRAERVRQPKRRHSPVSQRQPPRSHTVQSAPDVAGTPVPVPQPYETSIVPIVVGGLCGTFLAMWYIRGIGAGSAGWQVGGPWLIGIVCSAFIAWRSTAPGRSHTRMTHCTWLGAVPWVTLALLAVVPRVVWLDRYPSIIGGDEGEYLRIAVSASDGNLGNVFAAGWLGVPNLYPAVAGWLGDLFGGSIAAYRLLGASFGAIAVLATWRFGRRIVSDGAAWSGAAVLAIMPYHLYFSRSAHNHVTDSTTLMASLLFLHRALDGNRRIDAWVCGAIVGIGWYGYWGARLYPLVIGTLLAIAMTRRDIGLVRTIRTGLWITTGFIAVTAPLLMWFYNNPDAFRNRLDSTAITSLDAWRSDPGDVLRRYLDNVQSAITLPYDGLFTNFYMHPAPFLGWPVAIAMATGVCALLVEWFGRRDWRSAAWLAVPWILLSMGLAISYPIGAQRFIGLAPIWALVAGAGIVGMARGVAGAIGRRYTAVWRTLAFGAIAILAVANLAWWVSDDRLFTTYENHRAAAAWDIGWRLANGEGAAPAIQFLGQPFMFLGGWGNLQFLAPAAQVTDLDIPGGEPLDGIALESGSILIVIAERQNDRCAVHATFPDATIADVRGPHDTLLYTAFFRERPSGWSTTRTPAATTFNVVPPPSCALSFAPSIGSLAAEHVRYGPFVKSCAFVGHPAHREMHRI